MNYTEATPKSLMRVMGVHGLTLYHLKSHLQVNLLLHHHFLLSDSDFLNVTGLISLQKYRMGRSQHSQTSDHNKQEGKQLLCNHAWKNNFIVVADEFLLSTQEYGEKLSGHFTNKTTCDGAKEQINE